MNEETLHALRGSIEKWERIVAGAANNGPDDCPLCAMFNRLFSLGARTFPGFGCDGCPVKERTGKNGCNDTPYVEFDDAYGDYSDSDLSEDERQERRECAQAELDFLKSLLPQEGP
jgi:hypothetical protein